MVVFGSHAWISLRLGVAFGHCQEIGQMHFLISLSFNPMGQYIKNTRRVSFDIKFTGHGFEKAC